MNNSLNRHNDKHLINYQLCIKLKQVLLIKFINSSKKIKIKAKRVEMDGYGNGIYILKEKGIR